MGRRNFGRKAKSISGEPSGVSRRVMRAAASSGGLRRSARRLFQNLVHHSSPHIRQPEIAALKAEGQACVFQAQLVENRGL